MRTEAVPTRRSFLKAGALLATPVALPAAAAAAASAGSAPASPDDEAAIRALHHAWLRHAGAGGASELGEAIRRVVADHAGEPDHIEIAANGRSARGCFHCTVELETALPQDCTLGQMAHAQGSGFIRHHEARTLIVEYVKKGDAWTIARLEFGAA